MFFVDRKEKCIPIKGIKSSSDTRNIIFLSWEYILRRNEGRIYSYHGNIIVIAWKEGISHKSLVYLREHYIH